MTTASIVGSGPNGLAAAITLAQRGVDVTVYERNSVLGGSCSSGEVTESGFLHDLGSSVYPLGVASPFFRSLPLEKFGLRWLEPPVPLAHPLDDGTVVTLEHDIEDTCQQLGAHDGKRWRQLLSSPVKNWPNVVEDFTRPLLRFPSHPIAMAALGLPGLLPARTLATYCFEGEAARALFAGIAAHSVLPLTQVASSAIGIVLAAAGHTTGWPIVAGGAQALSNALAAYLDFLGGHIATSYEIKDLQDLPLSDIKLFDTSTAALADICGSALSFGYKHRLSHFKSGPGIFKVDFALTAPIPWRNAECLRAATVHVGGSLDEIDSSESDAFYGRHSDRPFVLLVQPSLFDAMRAPPGKHTAWAYCHVPTGSNLDRSDAIEAQIERFAPGFRDVILARRKSNANELGAWNPNLIGGDISGGAMTLSQLLFRPTAHGYRTSNPSVYLCSSSTPPGGGVHGMCGHLAALAALRDLSNTTAHK